MKHLQAYYLEFLAESQISRSQNERLSHLNEKLRAKLKDARANPSRREWHDREVILKRSKAQYSAGKFKHGLSDYIEEIVVKGVNILKSDSQASQRTQVSCDWCHLSFASRGINKHRFSCISKPENSNYAKKLVNQLL